MITLVSMQYGRILHELPFKACFNTLKRRKGSHHIDVYADTLTGEPKQICSHQNTNTSELVTHGTP